MIPLLVSLSFTNLDIASDNGSHPVSKNTKHDVSKTLQGSD